MQLLRTPLSHSFPTTTAKTTSHHLSSASNAFNSPLSLLPNLSRLSLSVAKQRPPSTLIRMGGGPRTYPGGVSKWQWKRMQAKKAKQLLKARLARERHIYEMRKRAELKAAVADLERPWELVQKAAPRTSTLFSVGADEQLKVLADRFQKPGGFDMWTENDGPQIFMTPDEGLPTARFFPKGVVHSIRPYGKIDQGNARDSSESASLDIVGSNSENRNGIENRKNGHRRRIGSGDEKLMKSEDEIPRNAISKLTSDGENWSGRRRVNNQSGGALNKDGDRTRFGTEDENVRKSIYSRQGTRGLEGGNLSSKMSRNGRRSTRGQNLRRASHLHSDDVYDMSLQGDGSYGFSRSNEDDKISSRSQEQRLIDSKLSE